MATQRNTRTGAMTGQANAAPAAQDAAPDFAPSQRLRFFVRTADGRDIELDSKAKRFSTGSVGYTVWGKASATSGDRFQVTANVVLIGSKPQA